MLNEDNHETISIFHTNDFHSHFANWPKIKRYILSGKKKERAIGNTVLTFDIGDFMDRFEPLTEATNGKAGIQFMNELDYDGVTIGNNEGLTNSKQQLDQLYEDANFDVLLANLKDPYTNALPKWANEAKLIVTPQHTRILVFGMTAPYSSTYPKLGWEVKDVYQTTERLLAKYEDQYDICILLSHLGLPTDRELAKQFPAINLILGGHTHHLLMNGELVNQTMLAAAQKWGNYVGHVTLTLANHQITEQNVSVQEVAALPSEPADLKAINKTFSMGTALLASQKVAQLDHSVKTQLLGSSEMVDLSLAALQSKAHTDSAIINTGLFLKDLPAGVIDENQIHDVLPHAMQVMKVTLDGYNLWRLIQEMEKNRNFLLRYPQKGMGFRGKVFGELHYRGIEYQKSTGEVWWHGEPLDPNRNYEVAMLDHYLYIPFFPTIQICGKNDIYFDENLRQVFARYLSEQFPIK
ncbi:5'-nucleotidase C-terminal domain-containing protein [Lentilactobacillus senioris]|uniref:bifunctional metallophosphatase/5'-nucleotidase n=1 Tax=Lentilactobacillus senioris TaxID=931534 RepID=UPI002280D825|nr:5'-nucleotidase C-terminal domain-containing protein [Lentilactobacillus senioris]MCY9806733.1 5'-nucleotidase C-terminal domain-containing protein [Lentilactobacillus senioris]